MATYKDFEIVPISPEMKQTASFLANERLLYEFPRKGYGQYQKSTHLENIKNGYLGELAFLKLITNKLRSKYSGQISELSRNYSPEAASNLFKSIKNEKFAYILTIGQPDEGYDFKKDNLLIDIKTYGTDYIVRKGNKYYAQKSNKEIVNLNLLIDKRQGQKWKGKSEIIFIQAFIEASSRDNSKRNVIFAGYHQGLPELNERFRNPAYACEVTKVEPMKVLLDHWGL